MTVTDQSQHRAEFDGRPYYFCSAKCLGKLPNRRATPRRRRPQPVQACGCCRTIYTCPMHPEIRQDHPGNCPNCGMTLELRCPELDEAENPDWSTSAPLLVDACR